jgi:hypothetical protein
MPDIPKPSRGLITWDCEGQEGGPFHSRKLHVPSGSSGLTIGRGYDMKLKTVSQIEADLKSAGVDPVKAKTISAAAGLQGSAAKQFITAKGLQNFEISPEAQVKLFEITYASEEAEVKRISGKPDCVAKYGAVDWQNAHPAVRDLMVDLKFRGDYTPDSRKIVQTLLARNDLKQLAAVIGDKARWPSVPPDRFNRRKAFMAKAVGG